ncbi:ABC transporter ATP-binding protein [Nocardia yunnanensis]|uniref:ABC transporter ATP-binding protein n=1 Tax=Nocardia yunnanensis TaxID=2382165 RepID=A0A386Z453_9NOCA|nr:ABC transporter ATP-binding protein [Nocardia yunnanensis]AYF72558.1 ABC transporter ATP-binding protein [Nocardia yunnanensis]
MTDRETLLTISDLSVRFGDRTVVDGVNVTVALGETVALVGESGSGKSLTARAVLGLLPTGASATGSITLDGAEIVGTPDAELRALRGTRAAMVFQEPQTALNPVQRIGTQIAEALRAHRKTGKAQARARAIELLELVDIPEPAKRVDWYPHQLSGGQKQRVVIALALSGDPDLLIADEPTTALDVTVQAEILHLLRDLQRRNNTAILFITHNLGVVAAIADRVVVMRAGHVIETAPVHALFAAPREDYTRELLSAVPTLPTPVASPIPPADPAAPDSPRHSGVLLAGTHSEGVDPGQKHAGMTETEPPQGWEGPLEAEPVLRVTDLSVVYRRLGKRFQALTDISLTLAPREVVGLVGESGSGKSTLGRAALGLIPAASGEVVLQGVALTGLPRRELRGLRKQVALVHQDVTASLDPRRSIEDSIGEPLRVHRAASGALLRARVGDLLESVRLPRGYAARRPGELSGGQRQRVALARALALAPRLLIADEPTSALDVSVQAQVLDLFADLRAEYGFACLFISHDLAVVHQVADRVVVLREGRIVESGPVTAVFGSPRAEYTRRLLEAVPAADPSRAQRDDEVTVEPLALGA